MISQLSVEFKLPQKRKVIGRLIRCPADNPQPAILAFRLKAHKHF